MLPPPWSVLEVFGAEDVALFRGVRKGGVAYLTDRYLAIRDDLVKHPPEAVFNGTPSFDAFPIPKAIPGPAKIALWPWILRRLDSVGVTVHASDDWKAQHLYLGTEHVGWLAGMRGDTDPEQTPAMTVRDIEIVRAIAARTPTQTRRGNMDTWDDAMDAWDDAALTLAQVRYWRTRVDADPGLCGGKAPAGTNGGLA